MPRCMPGVVCIENMSLVIVVVLCIIIVALLFSRNPTQVAHNDKIIIKEEHIRSDGYTGSGIHARPNYAYTNAPNDVLMNPYEPPLKDERYLVNMSPFSVPTRGVPINVSTNIGAVESTFRQVGILTPTSKSPEKILALLGKPIFSNRDKWQYYTMTKHNIKLPIIRNGKDAMNEYGVDIIYNNDVVFVQGYGEPFKVTIYENNTIKYLPFI